MSKNNYKRLGDYIQLVDKRNKELEVETLLGLSIEKRFIPSIANTIGTDMSTYKIVQPGQFAYGPVTSRNGDKITIALYDGEKPVIISQAYVTFEIFKREELDAEYLMMWFGRPEFDRYARFKSHGSAREIFDWETMCNVELPIPPILEQRAIVAQYQALIKRIETNNQLIAKLEDTAQTLYRKMFVDDIDKENLPDGWEMGMLGDVAEFAYGKMPTKSEDGDIPVFSGYAITGYTNDTMLEKQHIIIIARGDAGSGKVCLSPNICFLTNLAIAILLKNEQMKYYLYYHLKNSDTSILRSGSAQAQVTINSLMSFQIMIPITKVFIDFSNIIELLHRNIDVITEENKKLKELQSLLLAKMGRNKN